MIYKSQNIRFNDQEYGFTLIELLVAVAIIGILASIAIPEFNEYKKRAYDSAAISDLRNLKMAQEAYYVDNESFYLGSGDLSLILPGFVSSKNVTTAIDIGSDPADYIAASEHQKSVSIFCYDNSRDDSQKEFIRESKISVSSVRDCF